MYKSYIIDEKEIRKLVNSYPETPIYEPIVSSTTLKNRLRQLILKSQIDDKSLEAKNTWNSFFFHNLKMSVFISHSSKDRTFVRKFANWLYRDFEIVSFIDSDLKGCISELKKK